MKWVNIASLDKMVLHLAGGSFLQTLRQFARANFRCGCGRLLEKNLSASPFYYRSKTYGRREPPTSRSKSPTKFYGRDFVDSFGIMPREQRSRINLTVIGTGHQGTGKCVALKAGGQIYLFNCGEGSQRILHERRALESRIFNIFFTHLNWQNISGILGLCMTQQSRAVRLAVNKFLRLHGPTNVEKVFTESRSFARFHRIKIESRDASDQHFEDDYIKVEYVPFFPRVTSLKSEESQSKSIDLNALAAYVKRSEHGAPTSEYEAMLYIVEPKMDTTQSPKFIVLECPSEDFLDELENVSELEKFYAQAAQGTSEISVVVHFTPSHVFNREEYISFIERFGPHTKHLLVNESITEPVFGEMHSLQSLLNRIDPDFWPITLPSRIHGKAMPKPHPLVYLGIPGLRYVFGGALQGDFYRIQLSCDLYVSPDTFLYPYMRELRKIRQKKAEMEQDAVVQSRGNYPEVVFLGTSSTRPSNIRNVACILVHLSEDVALMLDCGENSLGQLMRYYGDEKGAEILRKIKAVYISHMHPDHHMGFLTLAEERYKLNCEDELYLLAPAYMEQWIATIERHMHSLRHLFRLVYLEELITRSLYYTSPVNLKIAESLDLRVLNIFRASHNQHATSLALTHNDGWTLVYSGDTAPGHRIPKNGENCDLLIHEATFDDALIEAAIQSSHCTVSEAIQVAMKTSAKYTILTHLNPRYRNHVLPDLSKHVDNLPLITAFDFMQVKPYQLPILCLYQSLLFKIMDNYSEHRDERYRIKGL